MKKWMLAMLVMVLVIGSVSAEWKDYEWGMSPEEVQAVEDLPWMWGEEEGTLSMDIYTTTVMGYLTAASFVFENSQLKVITLEIEGDVFTQAVDVYTDRYGFPLMGGGPDSDSALWFVMDRTFLSLEMTYAGTKIMYSEGDFTDRLLDSQDRQAENEL